MMRAIIFAPHFLHAFQVYGYRAKKVTRQSGGGGVRIFAGERQKSGGMRSRRGAESAMHVAARQEQEARTVAYGVCG